MKNKFFFLLFIVCNGIIYSQNSINLAARVHVDTKEISITQTITYKNTTKDTLSVIYLNDWMASYSNTSTALANRFADEFKRDFHFAKEEDKGTTILSSITTKNDTLHYQRLKNQIDVIEVQLDTPLFPQKSYQITLAYTVKIPNSRFTSYGSTKTNDLHLRYWYITPAIYNGKWNYYSNKNLNDAYIAPTTVNATITYPNTHELISELNTVEEIKESTSTTTKLYGKNRVKTILFLKQESTFKKYQTPNFTIVSDLLEDKLNATQKDSIITKIANYLETNLGAYPHERLLLSNIDYKKSPNYGLNLLPDFIRPFPETFQFELKVLKTALRNYLENTLLINPRKDQWLLDGIQVYWLMEYVNKKYPNLKIFGSLSKIWGIRSYHAAKLPYNSMYEKLYMNMATTNQDQPLLMAKDSLLKFNKDIANPNKAALGFYYLNHYDSTLTISKNLKTFVSSRILKPTNTEDFKTFITAKASKNIDWFFEEYLKTRKKIDYKITRVKKHNDSITITIKNKEKNAMPIALYTVNKDHSFSKKWIANKKDTTIVIPKKNTKKVILNKEHVVPEINERNNVKTITPHLLNKPLSIAFIKDADNPERNQLFLMPLVDFSNIYDGILLGANLNNKTILRKPFTFKVSPLYATKSNTLIGSSTIAFNHYFTENTKNLFRIYCLANVSHKSYAPNLFVTKIVPSIALTFRDATNLRSNHRSYFNVRLVSIHRDKDKNGILTEATEPNYDVFNIRYVNRNPELTKYFNWFADFQYAKNFSKLAFNYEYRKLYKSNRQIKFRIFAGTFLHNNTETDYFNFALDRPSDYLFDFGYLGRSESTGIFSQQVIIAEGGFKSKLATPFANQWMLTGNTSTTIWNYINAYGDIGVVKNKNKSTNFVYDSGINLALVEDYFEIYFPVYSNLGWEIAQPHYSTKIRFMLTLDLNSLLGLFRRRWF